MAGNFTVDSCEYHSQLQLQAYKDGLDPFGVGVPELNVTDELSDTLSDGTGTDKADAAHVTSGTIIASGNHDIDLSGGPDANAFGDTLCFTRIKCVKFRNTGTTWLRFGGYGANAWFPWTNANSSYQRVGPGGELVLWAPDATAYPVVAATADKLRITNEGASEPGTFKLTLIGEKGTAAGVSSSSSSSSSTSSTTTSTSSGSSSSQSGSSLSSTGGSSSSSSANSSGSSSSSS